MRTSTLSPALLMLWLAGAVTADNHPRIVNLGVPPGAAIAHAYDLSHDGSVVVGASPVGAWRWTASGGFTLINPGGSGTHVRDVHTNADGSILVIGISGFEVRRIFRWTQSTGSVAVSAPQFQAEAWGITADGAMVVGSASTWAMNEPAYWAFGLMQPVPAEGAAFGVNSDGSVIVGGPHYNPASGPAWRWTPATGTEILPLLPNSAISNCRAQVVSADGATIAGVCLQAQNGPWRPVVWTQSGIAELPRDPSWFVPRIWGITEDGSVMVGENANPMWTPVSALIWTPEGVFDLHTYLSTRGINLHGWVLTSARAITPAGDAIAGYGLFHGQHRPWVAYLSGCYANCDGNSGEPMLSIDDFVCFIDRFASATALPHEEQILHYANCDHSTVAPVLNVDDFMCFINAFAADCH